MLEEKDKHYLRSLKDLGEVNIDTFSKQNQGTSNNNIDIKVFQDNLDMKDKELCDMRIKFNSAKQTLKEQNVTIEELRSQNAKLGKELDIEKQKNSTKVMERQITKLKKEIVKKEKENDD